MTAETKTVENSTPVEISTHATDCLGCNLVEHQPRTLIDGGTVCSSCPAWLHECEARSLLAMVKAERTKYFEAVETKRGALPAEALFATYRKLAKSAKGAA